MSFSTSLSFRARLFAATVLAFAAADGASAQGATQAPTAPAPKESESTVAGLLVTGERPAAKSSIDRRTYAVSKDLQGATGSISDVLANLPSVEVDLEGNVKLRGESGVQILVDGKPSALMIGSNRAMALQMMPANTVESVEIMTNPSAEFSPEGAAGIINLVTKKARAPGASGAVRARVASEGRLNASALANYKVGKLALTGNFSVSRDESERRSLDERTQVDPATLLQRRNTRTGALDADRRSWGGSVGVDYDLTKSDRLSASVSHYTHRGEYLNLRRTLVEVGDGAILDYDRLSRQSNHNRNQDFSANYRHAFAERERDLRVDFRYGESRQGGPYSVLDSYRVPATLDRLEERTSFLDDTFLNFSADYAHPFTSGAKLRTGYSFQDTGSDRQTEGWLIDPATGATSPLPNETNHFVFGRAIHALYATFQRPMGKWTALGGLRVEQVEGETDQRVTGQVDRTEDLSLYPSLHLQYDLADSQRLKFSYSHRVARPGFFQLDPRPYVVDEFNVVSGNPRLKPQDTHSLEAGWEYAKGGRSYLATLYLRRFYNGITPVSRLISPTVVLTTQENLAENTSGGLELVATGKALPQLTYNLSGNLFYNELSSLDGGESRSAIAHSAKARLDYKISPSDLVQLSASHTGRRLRQQGYTPSSTVVHFGYQRKIRPDLIAVVAVSDLFKAGRSARVTETPDFREISVEQGRGRTFSLALTKVFGGRRPAESEIEYIQ